MVLNKKPEVTRAHCTVNVSGFYVFKRPAIKRWTGFNVKQLDQSGVDCGHKPVIGPSLSSFFTQHFPLSVCMLMFCCSGAASCVRTRPRNTLTKGVLFPECLRLPPDLSHRLGRTIYKRNINFLRRVINTLNFIWLLCLQHWSLRNVPEYLEQLRGRWRCHISRLFLYTSNVINEAPCVTIQKP